MNFLDRYEHQLVDAARRRASAVPASTSPPRRSRRGVWLGGLAAAGLAAAAAGMLLPAGSKLSPVQQAQAQLGGGDAILHFRVNGLVPSVDGTPIASAAECRGEPQEFWVATQGALRERVRRTMVPPDPPCGDGDPYVPMADGTPMVGMVEEARSGNITLTFVPALKRAVRMKVMVASDVRPQINIAPEALTGAIVTNDHKPVDLQAQLRALLSHPGLRDEGETMQSGRKVRTFVVPEAPVDGDDPDRPKDGTVTYVVDAESFAPVTVTVRGARMSSAPGEPKKFQYVTEGLEFFEWERLPVTPANEALLEIDLPPDVTTVSGTSDEWYRDSTREERKAREAQGRVALESYLAARNPPAPGG